MNLCRWLIAISLLSAAMGSNVAVAQLKLKVHPLYTADRSHQVFEPLRDYLQTATGQVIELDIPRDYQHYWLQIRRGETPDLSIDDAHITSYRIANQGYRPLIRSAEDLEFSILTTGDLADDATDAFIGKTISTMPAPSLGYMVLSQLFPNPMAQPIVVSSARSWRDGVEIIFAMEADAAIAPNHVVDLYPNLYPVYTSDSFPGMTLSVAPDVPQQVADALRDALLVLHENQQYYRVLNELNSTQFVSSTASEYDGLDQILGTIYGGR